VSSPERVPVVCIHGALRSRVGMWPTAWYLRRLGLDARAFGYATRRGSLRTRAERLDAFVDGWLGTDAPPPVLGFLTHSMGGLVVRAWLASGQLPTAQRQRIVMLSPPNQGSQLARRNAESPWFRLAYGEAAA
jgi:triacylglycerol esterase/lipase EstA (alpha/beta hydrolase family)